MELVAWERLEGWTEVWSLAVVFGLASVPWTYAFVAGVGLPLCPRSFSRDWPGRRSRRSLPCYSVR